MLRGQTNLSPEFIREGRKQRAGRQPLREYDPDRRKRLSPEEEIRNPTGSRLKRDYGSGRAV